jgi:hypothetical protein
MVTTTERPPTARLGLEEIAVAMSSAAVPGTAVRGVSVRSPASGIPPTAGATILASGLGGRLPPNFYLVSWERKTLHASE